MQKHERSSDLQTGEGETEGLREVGGRKPEVGDWEGWSNGMVELWSNAEART